MMIIKVTQLLAVAAILAVAGATAAVAGRSCEPSRVSGAELARRADWAVEIWRRLKARDLEVALVARVGSDVSEYGLRYTHVGFVWRDHPKGRWSVVHVLNVCEEETSKIFDQGLLNFLLDDPFALDVLILELKPGLQNAIARRLKAGRTAVFKGRRYSTLAYPFSARYQNSNQWLLEVLAAAQGDLTDRGIGSRSRAQSALRDWGYRGTAIRLSPMKQAMARMTRRNIAFDDHPREARRRGAFETITVRSIRDYLRHQGQLVRVDEMIYPYPERFERRRAEPTLALRRPLDDRP